MTIIDGYIGELGLLNQMMLRLYGFERCSSCYLVPLLQWCNTYHNNWERKLKEKSAYNTYLVSRSFSNFNIKCYWYALLLNESYANSGSAIPFKCKYIEGTIGRQDAVLGAIISHDLFSGGSDKIYSVSGSHLDQEGIVGRLNLDF
jgi:hypothetical protein